MNLTNFESYDMYIFFPQFILKNQLEVNIEDVDGTIHCREAAAVNLLESLYEILTNRKYVWKSLLYISMCVYERKGGGEGERDIYILSIGKGFCEKPYELN